MSLGPWLKRGLLPAAASVLLSIAPFRTAHGSRNPPALPGSQFTPRSSSRPQIPEHRGRRLVAGVAVSGAVVVAGGLLFIPPGLCSGSCHGSSIMPYVIAGTTAIVLGGVSTLVTATFLAHHQRWDASPRRIGDRIEAERAKAQRRRLIQTLQAAAGITAAGVTAIGIGYAAGAGCLDRPFCPTERATVGVAIGGPLVMIGGFMALSSGILLGLHKRHRHREIDAPANLSLAPGGLTLRF